MQNLMLFELRTMSAQVLSLHFPPVSACYMLIRFSVLLCSRRFKIPESTKIDTVLRDFAILKYLENKVRKVFSFFHLQNTHIP